jgi:D-arabinose 5-phosphate isomerase GutQ/beta-phosphoglucomutase-like phosphatase (HAD superfamily)
MNKILEYDLFIFDFDGTLMDTEEYHYLSWKNALSEYEFAKNIDFSMSDYQKYFHTLDGNNSKTILKLLYNITDYNEIYKIKQKYYQSYVIDKDIKFINGAEDFLNFIINNNKKFIIVSNTSDKFMKIYLEKHDILKKANKIYTKEYFINRKPNPECYLRILNDYPNDKKIGFEDSLVGMHSLYQVNKITPVLIYDTKYFYLNKILEDYKNIILFHDFNIKQFNNYLTNKIIDNSNLFINKILDNNIEQLKNNYNTMYNIIYQISILISNLNSNNHIYLSGMGKSGYVCKKSVSTWQSLSIKCSYIDLPNLPHGDFGMFKDNDLFILISNSGNTDEIIYILKYLNNNLNKKINTISIVANKNSEMEKLSNITYILDNIVESDNINMTPSTSSLIFMSLLDSIAINIKKNITKEEFQLVHPAGSLGKR